MSRATTFVETPKGICVINTILAEFTICGDAFDLYANADFDEEVADYRQKPTKLRIVTCPDCAAVVKDLKNVRVEDANAN